MARWGRAWRVAVGPYSEKASRALTSASHSGKSQQQEPGIWVVRGGKPGPQPQPNSSKAPSGTARLLPEMVLHAFTSAPVAHCSKVGTSGSRIN